MTDSNSQNNFLSTNVARVNRTHFGCLAFAIFAALVCASTKLDAQVQPDIIRRHAYDLQCVAVDLKDEIKAHFKGTPRYGKLLGTNAQIKSRAATIERRIKRDPYYRSLKRDLEKLDELTCRLNTVFDEALDKHAHGVGRPIKGNPIHVADRIVNMIEISRWMTAVYKGQVIVDYEPALPPVREFGPAPQRAIPSRSEFRSEFEPYDPNYDVAPGVLVIPPSRDHSVLKR